MGGETRAPVKPGLATNLRLLFCGVADNITEDGVISCTRVPTAQPPGGI